MSNALQPAPPRLRLDIQGMRALAVLAVVAYHAGLPVPGGFVGVDIFFVISGFVIANLLIREWQATQRIRFTQFYLRRFKRLTPALALVVTVTVAASLFVLSPAQQQAAAQTGAGAMLLLSNVIIAVTTSGYFAPAAEDNPLLNMWSLSVEEQFYLFFPALIAFGWAVADRARTRALRAAPLLIAASVTLLSLGLVLLGPGGSAFTGFFSPLTRAWEFMLGALLALTLSRTTKRLPLRMASIVSLLGFVLTLGSFWLINSEMEFPSGWTLIPVTGALLLLLGGADSDNPVSRALTIKPAVRVGDWSYSLYLWHWPFILFATTIWSPSPLVGSIAAAVSLPVAIASYYWVEQPLRRWERPNFRTFAPTAALIVIAPLAVSAAALGISQTAIQQESPGFAFRTVHQGDIGQQPLLDLMSTKYFPCTFPVMGEADIRVGNFYRCMQSKPDKNLDIAILGDSHAEHLFVGLAEALPDQNVIYQYLPNFPLRDTSIAQEAFTHVANDPHIRTVVVNSHWSLNPPNERLTSAVQTLLNSGKRVIITDDIPRFASIDPFQCKYVYRYLPDTAECSQPQSVQQQEYKKYVEQLRERLPDNRDVHLVSTYGYFCNQGTCDMRKNNVVMYYDRNHVNAAGSRYLVNRMLKENPHLRKILSR